MGKRFEQTSLKRIYRWQKGTSKDFNIIRKRKLKPDVIFLYPYWNGQKKDTDNTKCC